MYTGFDSLRIDNPIIYKKYLPESFSVIFHTSEPASNDGYQRIIEASYKGFTQGIICEDLSDGDEIVFDDFFTMIDWTGTDGLLRIISTDDNHNLHCDTNFPVQEIKGTLHESGESIGKRLAQLLTEKGIESTYDEGFTTLINKASQLTLNEYSPNLIMNPCQTLVSGCTFSVNNGVAGGYHQCGYVSDGFYNSTKDWVLSLRLNTSKWDGGFCLFGYPYPLQTCSEYRDSQWDCIMKNGQSDILLFLDGQLQQNTSVGSLRGVGIWYTRNASIDVKIVKAGTDLYYYEDGVFKGKFIWDKLSTAKRFYLGTLTWGGSGSVNSFSNVLVERNAMYFADKCNASVKTSLYDNPQVIYKDNANNNSYSMNEEATYSTLNYNNTQDCYELIAGNSDADKIIFYPIPYMTGATNFIIEADIKSPQTLFNRVGFGFVDGNDDFALISLEHNQNISNWGWFEGNSNSISMSAGDTQSFTETWYHVKIIANSNAYSCFLSENDIVIADITQSTALDIPTRKIGMILSCPQANQTTYWIKNITITGSLS